MEKHLKQAAHNRNALEKIQESFPDDFFDWKITLCFYISLHYIRAFAQMRSVPLGNSHFAIKNILTPPDGSASPLGLSSTLTINYQNLYRYSRSARYDGFCSKSAFDHLCRNDFAYAFRHMEGIETEVLANGLSILPSSSAF